MVTLVLTSPGRGACDLTVLGWCLVAGQLGELTVREEAEPVRHRLRATAQEGPPPVRQRRILKQRIHAQSCCFCPFMLLL